MNPPRKKLNVFTRALCYFFAFYMAVPFSVWAGLTINPPTFPTTNTINLTLSGTQTNLLYNIQYTPALGTIPFSTVATGAVGQTSFTLTIGTSNANFFRAYGTNGSTSLVVATPTLSPGAGAYSTPQIVTISCATPLVAIYYTTNGATPTTSDNFIASGGTVTLNSMVTLKAKAFRSGYTDSAVASATYQINSPPVVNAGPQQTISSSSTTLQGYVTDDGLPAGSSLTNTWSKLSGPSTVTFGNLHQTNSTATFGANGIYVLQLTGTDGQYTGTNTVTIAVNPTLTVSLTAPTTGSTYTVPTNFTFEATASCSSGSITQVAFYANNALAGIATNAPYTFNWYGVFAGNLNLTAVASTTDSANTGLASSPVNVTVNWPTNVGQVAYSTADLQIPAAGLPIAISRLYDTRFGSSGSVGNNGKLDYERINIQAAAFETGWQGSHSVTWCAQSSSSHLVTVTLGEGDQYYFEPQVQFVSSGNGCINTFFPTGYSGVSVYLTFTAANGQGKLTMNAPSNLGLRPDDGNGPGDGCLGGPAAWSGPLKLATFDPDDAQTCSYLDTAFEPDLSSFTFTSPDGTTYNFDSSGNLSQHTDRNGNYLQYGYGGITHSSGRQVTFTRDGSSRITEIYDPIAIASSGSPAVKYAYDGIGNLTNVAQLVQRSPAIYQNTGYVYGNVSFPNNVTAVIDPRGVTSQQYAYDANGRLNRQYDALNRYIIYTYDLSGHRQITVDRLSNTTIQNFTPSGQLGSIQDAQGEVTQYGYDSQGRKIAETNGVKQVTTYTYDANNNLVGTTNGLQQSSSSTYNQFGELLIAADNLGNGTTNGYDSHGNLIAVTNAFGVVILYGYDAQGNQVAQTNAFGTALQRVTQYQYNQFGDLTNIIDALSNVTGYTCDANGNRKTQTKTRTAPSGQQTLLTTWIYDAANRATQTIDPDGFTNTTIYNPIGKVFQTIDKLNRTNSFYYDPIGLLTNTTFPDGLFETYGYDAAGRRTSSIDRATRMTVYGYDNVGRLTFTFYPDGTASGTTFDAAGQMTVSTQYPVNPAPPGLPTANAINTYYGYDAAGRRTALTNALQQVTRYAFDANGNQTNQLDALLHNVGFLYDRLGHQTQVQYADTTADSYGFDALGRRNAATNQAGVVTRFGYDPIDRLTSVTNAFGTPQQTVTLYVYDEVGNLTQEIDALSHTNKFEYDAMGRRTKQTLPALQFATFGYDSFGNQIRVTNFNGSIITNQYDALNRLTNKASTGGYKITFAFNAVGQRTNMIDASGTTGYTYDGRDRLLTKVSPEGTLTYTYDALGNLFTIQSSTANGTSLTYYHDNLNRVTNCVDRFTNNAFYAFDGVGNLQNSRYQNGVTNAYSYDSLNRLTNVAVKASTGTIANFGYRLAQAGNRTNLAESVNGVGRTNTWAYDALFRLTNELITASGGGLITYKYDAVGNRTNRASTITSVSGITNSFNGNDQLGTDVYDSNGNTRTNAGNIFAYDVENHLTNAAVGGTNIAIVYDGDGNRVKKTVGGTATYYLVDDRNATGYAQVLEELATVGSTPTRLYTYGLDLVCQRQSGGTTSFFGRDGNGSTRFLTSSSGAISDTYAYDAFGDQLSSTGLTPNNYLYVGQQFDANVGFYYLRARYMNPNSGRFMSRDAFEGSIYDPSSLHKYTYAGNDPINHTDPTGKFTAIEAFIAVATVTAIVLLVYGYKHIGKPMLQQASAVTMTPKDLDAAKAQLKKYAGVDPKINLLLGALDDGTLSASVFKGSGAGQHLAINNGTIFISQSTLDQGPLATALVMFGEFQHDTLSNEIQDEKKAQVEFSALREAIRKLDSNAITPYIDSLNHGSSGF